MFPFHLNEININKRFTNIRWVDIHFCFFILPIVYQVRSQQVLCYISHPKEVAV